jgi:hypothetical protein
MRTIGEAEMLADGTLVLRLRAEGEGMIGDGVLTYPPGDERLPAVLAHLGGLRPGERKPVAAWQEEAPRPGQASGLKEAGFKNEG